MVSTIRKCLGGGCYSLKQPLTWPGCDSHGENRNWFLLKNQPICEAHQFLSGEVFSTNVSIFQYRIILIDGPSDGFLYSGEPLGSMCYFFDSTVLVDKARRTVQSNVGLMHLVGPEN